MVIAHIHALHRTPVPALIPPVYGFHANLRLVTLKVTSLKVPIRYYGTYFFLGLVGIADHAPPVVGPP